MDKTELKQTNLTNFSAADCRVGWKDRYGYKSRKESERSRLLGNGAQQAEKGRLRRKQAKRLKYVSKEEGTAFSNSSQTKERVE